jgi:galactose-1-phosphate uridylyltransferase
MAGYLADPAGRGHVLDIVRTRLSAGGRDADLPEEELLEYAPAYFAGGHDVIVARRHFTDEATHTDQLASSGMLTPEEHFAFTLFTIDGIDDLYQRNRYAPYVVAFQNWLAPAGASFEHLHKQLVAIDSRSVQAELEISRLRLNPNMYNEWGVDYAGYRNLIIAENEHAVVHAGFGHRYPTLTIYSRSPIPEPWLQSNAEIRGMSDLIHACHAATGAEVAVNEEWHHRPVDLDMPMPWRVNIKWRVSTLAGFEGGTKIFVNTLSPDNIRDRVVSAMYRLRDEGRIAPDIRIATECDARRNTLLYNPLLQ